MDKIKVALIAGVTGQDGAYLREFLLKENYIVHGTKRRSSQFNTDRIDHLYQDPHIEHRNFILHADDMAKAVIFAVENKLPDHLYNIGSGKDLLIRELVNLIQKTAGHQGGIIWDTSKPDGTPRKLLNVSGINKLGWQTQIDLKEGIQDTYNWYCDNIENIKEVSIK
ncbi:NAD-dependent epimerase/dehydratase family protein [Flavivirga sp. Y03]|uniref:GDP-mannose 4,6-dehydratase n=1 Tax=Flavivirga algicola TaxID=2729136 RepID=A0ABX1RXV7_9FLAO|nr:NAD-dependent epimerase/dehydratase family protein [Flavivirga algicola]